MGSAVELLAEPLSPGTFVTAPHFGHLASLPASSSLVLSRWPLGQVNSIAIMVLGKPDLAEPNAHIELRELAAIHFANSTLILVGRARSYNHGGE